MGIEIEIEKLRRLQGFLHEALLLPSIQDGQEPPRLLNHLFQDICNVVFTDDYYLDLWDESVLSQLLIFFKIKPPNPKIYGEKLSLITERRDFVHKANEFIYSIINNSASAKEVSSKLSELLPLEDSTSTRLEASGHLETIRSANSLPSEKIDSYISHLKQDIGLSFEGIDQPLENVLLFLKAQETYGKVNALMLNTATNQGILLSLSLKLSPGKGNVNCLVSGGSDFKTAIERARHAMISKGFLGESDDVSYSLEITEAEYSGDSIGLAAAIVMYSAKMKRSIDPFTAFTGNINLDGGQYKITAVKGVASKLKAALVNGCKRVFISRENQAEASIILSDELKLHYVSDLSDVLLELQNVLEPLPGDTLHSRKINLLKAHCQENGWILSLPEPIQNGFQFTITPFEPPEMKVNIYSTGTHSPKAHHSPVFADLLRDLINCDEPGLPIRNINELLIIKELDLRKQIKDGLENLKPSEKRTEQYCEYSYRFIDGKENLAVKQYSSGKLLLQGSAGILYKKILEIIVPLCNLTNPKANLSVEKYLTFEISTNSVIGKTAARQQEINIPYPYIGTDESGKGDYFGPLVIAGVFVDIDTEGKLVALGVRDSKQLYDKRILALAEQIKALCPHFVVPIEPARYNELYANLKNLNRLLAWGHAWTLENLLVKVACDLAIVDKFGDDSYVRAALQARGRQISVIQQTHAEADIAVAAASILARARFVQYMEQLSRKVGKTLPKGASNPSIITIGRELVAEYGEDILNEVAKLHFKTTEAILQS